MDGREAKNPREKAVYHRGMVSVAARAPRGPSRAKQWVVLAIVIAAAAVVWFRAGVVSDVFGRQVPVRRGPDDRRWTAQARLTINASLAALNTLRGLDVDPLASSVDRDRIRALYRVECRARHLACRGRGRRHGRRFVQINLEFDDVRRLHEAAPLSWSRYELTAGNGQHLFRQIVGASALKPGTLKNVGWDGGEIVAFRLHLPSRILEHNARDIEKNEPTGIHRGNILGWEQHLADRLDGKPVDDRSAHGQPVDPLPHALPVRGRLHRRRADAGPAHLVDMRRGREEPVLTPRKSQIPSSKSQALPTQSQLEVELGGSLGS